MTLVFLTFHGISHFNASFRIAQLLGQQHTIVFAGFPGFQRYVESQGFQYYPLESLPFGLGFEEWVNEREKKKNSWSRLLADRWNNRLFHQRQIELEKLINDLQPSFIFVDAQQPTDFVVLYPHSKSKNIRLAILHTMLPHVVRAGYPPLNSSVLPGRHLEVSVARGKFLLLRTLKKTIAFLRFMGNTNESLVKSAMRSNGTPLRFLSRSASNLSIHLQGPSEIILSSLEFDFASSARSENEYYAGFMPWLERREVIDDRAASFLASLRTSTLPLIYCSFGSVQGYDEKTIDRFMQRLTEALTGKPVLVAISAMAMRTGDFRKSLPANFFLFDPAPQLALLAKARLFITHGGINSIKESVYAGVPMLVCPVERRLDQNGNATRVLVNKLGLCADIRKDSSSELLRKINEILQNPLYIERVVALRNTDQQYSDKGFRAIFQKYWTRKSRLFQ